MRRGKALARSLDQPALRRRGTTALCPPFADLETVMPPRRKSAARKSKPPAKYWSARVMRQSDALDLEPGAFRYRDPKRIARSLKTSAERNKRRKAGPFQSAMSMLTFYINRAGRNLPAARKKALAQTKVELRRLFDRA
jgi:Protein of unknown function (DUF3175)